MLLVGACPGACTRTAQPEPFDPSTDKAGHAAQAPVWSPAHVPALAGARLVRPGQHHTLALAASGGLLSAGRPTYGRLGRAGADPASDDALPAPAPVEGLDGVEVVGLAAGALPGLGHVVGFVFVWTAWRSSAWRVRCQGEGVKTWVLGLYADFRALLKAWTAWRSSAWQLVCYHG